MVMLNKIKLFYDNFLPPLIISLHAPHILFPFVMSSHLYWLQIKQHYCYSKLTYLLYFSTTHWC